MMCCKVTRSGESRQCRAVDRRPVKSNAAGEDELETDRQEKQVAADLKITYQEKGEKTGFPFAYLPQVAKEDVL